MNIKRAYTLNSNEKQAIQEIKDKIYQDNLGVVMLFCSPKYNLEVLGTEIKNQFGKHLIFACTTSGEIGEDGYIKGGITSLSLSKDFGNFYISHIDDVKSFDLNDSEKLVSDFRKDCVEFISNPKKFTGLLLIDGLSKAEDVFLNSLAKSFFPMEIIGGSSGDDLQFKGAYIYHDGFFVQNSAVLLIIESFLPFITFKTHHFTSTDKKLVVTSGDYAERIVYELNAELAGIEYASMLGLKPEDLNSDIFAAHPLMIKVENEWYVRGIAQMNDDLSFSFYCAIDEGAVLTLANSQDIIADLNFELTNLKNLLGNISLIIAFDCIQRRIEVESKNLTSAMNNIFKSENFFGFNTYGEQCDSVHVNQTITGIAFGTN